LSAVLGRTNIGWYSFLVCFPLSWYYLYKTVLIPYPYREGLTALLSAGTFLPLMVAAVASAWEGGRLSDSSVAISTSPRHPLIIATLSILPTFIVVTLSHLAATAIVLASHGVNRPLPEPRLYLGLIALIYGISILSWFVGYFFTNVIGAPLMAVLVYLLAISPSLTSHIGYRAMVADRSTCCGIDEQVDWRSVATPLYIALGLILVSLAIASWLWIRRGVYPVLGLIGVAAIVAGLVLPGQMTNRFATSPRDADQFICETSTETSIKYCVWPEQRSSLSSIREFADKALKTWSEQGVIGLPKAVSSRKAGQTSDGYLAVSFPPNPTQGAIGLALATGSLPDPSLCQGQAPRSFGYFQLVIWLAIDGGASPDDTAFKQFRGRGSSGSLQDALAIRQQPINDQITWYTQNSEALRSCTTTLGGS